MKNGVPDTAPSAARDDQRRAAQPVALREWLRALRQPLLRPGLRLRSLASYGEEDQALGELARMTAQ